MDENERVRQAVTTLRSEYAAHLAGSDEVEATERVECEGQGILIPDERVALRAAAHDKVVALVREAIGVCLDAGIGCEADLSRPTATFNWDIPEGAP